MGSILKDPQVIEMQKQSHDSTPMIETWAELKHMLWQFCFILSF